MPQLVVGIDTHTDTHTACALDATGKVRGTCTISATPEGTRQLIAWAKRLGQVDRVGIEGTGSYGAQLARELTRHGWQILEVPPPPRAQRARRGTTDGQDAQAAAWAVLSGQACALPKARTGQVEAIRALRIARRSAVQAITKARNQLHALTITAPAQLRAELGVTAGPRLVTAAAALAPARTSHDPEAATRLALRTLARRIRQLTREIAQLDRHLAKLVAKVAAPLTTRRGIATQTAAQLLVTAGDNPHRLTSEAAWAAVCGVAPLPACSGRTDRHRLNRGGDRHANAALYTIVLTRLRTDARTKAYVARRTRQGRSKPEIIRCLKRYVAREVYALLKALPALQPPLTT